MNRRRSFLWAALAILATRAWAQALAPTRKLGILGVGDPGEFLVGGRKKVLDGLARLGYAAGQNLDVVERFEPTDPEGLARKARELVALRVDAILTEGTPATLAAQAATRTIPIVTTVGDPVAAGFARELHRPGGNITGLSQNRAPLARKVVELVRLLQPRARRLAIVYEEPLPGIDVLARPFQEAAREASMTAETIGYRAGEIAGVFAAIKDRRIDFALNLGVPMADLKYFTSHRIPLFGQGVGQVMAGALVSIENDFSEDPAALAATIAKVFKGTPPGEIPFVLPSRYLSALNTRTAAALGIALTPELLLRVDRIVE